MATAEIRVRDETAIRRRVESWLKAARAGDLEAIMAHYAPEVIAYDAIAQLQFRGAEAYRRHWQACLEMCPGTPVFEMHDLHVTAAADVAFCHFLVRCGARDEQGQERVSWMRATTCFREIDGQWMIVHEHFSAPFEPQSGKTLLELQP